MAVVNGSLKGRGNYKLIDAPNTDTAADRRYTFGTKTGKVFVLVTDGTAYYEVGDATVDLTGESDSDMGYNSTHAVIDVSAGVAMSWFALSDTPSIQLWEVE